MLPEEQLLIALGKPHPHQRDWRLADAALSSAEFSWPEALRLSRSQRVQAMLAWNLKACEAAYARIPTTVRTELAMALLSAKARRRQYHVTLAPVLEELAAAGIPFTLMKGAVAMETAYPPDSRWLNDLDVLVPVSHRPAALNAFLRHGFRANYGVPAPDASHQLSLVTEGDGVHDICVDLHWNVYPPTSPFHFDVDDVIARARPQRFGDRQVLGMSPEDVFVHYATQLFTDEFRPRLGRFSDMYSLWVQSEPHQVSAIASASGAAGITHTALSALGLLGASVHRDVLDGLAERCSGCSIASNFLADHRWVVGDRRAAHGVISSITPLLLPDSRRRLEYRRLWRLNVYAYKRGLGYSAFTASLLMVHAMLSKRLCSVLLLMLRTAGPEAAKKRLRDLMWRDW
jgi:hypothetical protein